MIQAALHELEVRVKRYLAFDLQSQDVGRECILARSAQMLPKAQHGGENQDTGVADLRTTVIVVQGVGNGTIGQGRVWNRNSSLSKE